MAINNIINESWQGHSHGEVEDALKAALLKLAQDIENYTIQPNSVTAAMLSADLRDVIVNAVPNSRTINGKSLAGNITLKTSDIQNDSGYITQDDLPESATPDNAMSGDSENAVQNKVIKDYVDAVSRRIDTLIGSGNVQGAIDTFNEVVAFLNGINSSDTLAAKLLLKADAANVYTKDEIDAFNSSNAHVNEDACLDYTNLPAIVLDSVYVDTGVSPAPFVPSQHVGEWLYLEDGKIHHPAYSGSHQGAPTIVDIEYEPSINVLYFCRANDKFYLFNGYAMAEKTIGSGGGGGYTPPAGGIPKSDLSQEVQASLGKADTALQQHQDISGKVDKVQGKGLSTNDYTTAEKDKLAGLSAQVQSDWEEIDSSSPAYIQHKPTIPTAIIGKSAYDIALDNGFVGTEAEWLASLIGSCAITGDGSNIIALIVNDLVTGGAGNILSAEMGKQLAIQSLVIEGTFADAYEKAKHHNYVFPWMLKDVDDNDNQITKMIWHAGDLKFIDAIGSTIEGDTYVMTSETNPAMMAICYNNGFAASPYHITKREARAATGSAGQFNQSGVTHIDVRYFTGLVTNISHELGNISGKKLTLPAKPSPMAVNSSLGAAYSNFTVIVPPEVTTLDLYFINNTSKGKNAKVICESDTPFQISQSRGKWFADMPIEEVTMYVPSSAVAVYKEHPVFGKYEVLSIEEYTE